MRAPVTNTTLLQVPQLSYNGSAWAVHGPISSDRAFWSASTDMQKAGFAAAVTGQVVGALHTYANQTYSLDFSAPAIQCSDANDTVQAAAKEFFNFSYGSGGHLAFYSWVGGDSHDVVAQTSSSSSSGTGTDSNWQSLDVVSPDAARIFILSTMEANVSLDNMVTECVLHNATYSVDFAVQGGVPSAFVSQLTVNEGLPALQSLGVSDQVESEMGYNGTRFSCQAVMDVFGKLLVGYARAQSQVEGTEVYYSSFERTSVEWEDKMQMRSDLETLFQNITLSMFSNSNLL